jgi:lipoprotein-anchoring transpeptidase ErfK/SrfK
MFYLRRDQGGPNETKRETILIPLDTTIQPKAFPQFDQNFSAYAKMILIDREKQLLAYYEHGQLVACLPVSTGRSGKGTPAMEGWVSLRDKNHVSSIYDVLMPFSLRLSGPYFLHAGVMPGQRDSA